MKKFLAILLALSLCLMAAACSDSGTPQGTSAAPAPSSGGETAAPETSAPEDSGTEALSIGYYGISPTSGFFKEAYDTIAAVCEERGYELHAQFTDADPVKMRSAYDQFKMMDVDIIVDANAIIDVMQPFADEALEDGINYLSLFVTMDEPHYTFGTSNSGMGLAAGTFIGELVRDEWNSELDGIILVGTFSSSPQITERLTSAVPVVEEIIGKEVSNVIEIDADAGDTATTYQRMMSTLTANTGHYAVFCQTDDIANAVFSAVEAAGRQDEIMGTGSDCIEITLEYFKAAVDSGNMTVPWRGSIYLDTNSYGPQIIDFCEQIVNGTATVYALDPPADIGSIYNLYELFPELEG